MAAEVETISAWLAEAEASVSALPTYVNAPLKAFEISAKVGVLANVCEPIMSKPKPVPVVEVAPDEPAEAAAEGADADAPPAAAADMDVD